MLTRRDWIKAATSALVGAAASRTGAIAADTDAALIAISLDLEMSRNFPKWEQTHWDFEKGNLNDETKRYSVEAARRVKASGGVLHFFAVGRVLEHESVEWLREIAQAGHPIGNHTYDHINVTATRLEDLQFRFRRAPWLLRGMTLEDAIHDNIALTNTALKARLELTPAGFRTPGGFNQGLKDQPRVRAILRELGFDWVSSLYPSHANTQPMQAPSAAVLDDIVAAQKKAQPFVYPDGLVEVPMSPISDIGAFRTGRWKLEWFLEAIERGVKWAIETRSVFDFLAHPSCLYVVDPEFKTIELICRLVRDAGDKAKLVDLGTIAAMTRAKQR